MSSDVLPMIGWLVFCALVLFWLGVCLKYLFQLAVAIVAALMEAREK